MYSPTPSDGLLAQSGCDKTPADQPIVMPAPHIPLAPIYPPDFDAPRPAACATAAAGILFPG
eukprot:scaffold19235_cov126-Isochrysis_galbana.AAC.2